MAPPTLNSYEYMYKDQGTGVLLNQNASAPPFWDVRRIVGISDFPDLPVDTLDLDGRHGSFVNSKFFRHRSIVFEGELVSVVGDVETNIQALKNTIIPDGIDYPLYWKHPNVTQRYYSCQPAQFSADVEAGRRTGVVPFILGFTAGDPRSFIDLATANWSSGVDTAGFINAGNVDGALEVRVTANATTTASLVIANTFQFRTVTLTFPVSNGQAVVVDTNTWTVRVAGNVVPATQTPGGNNLFPSFYPGNNIWRVTSNIGNGTIVAKSAWL
jgi:hypothetical protein